MVRVDSVIGRVETATRRPLQDEAQVHTRSRSRLYQSPPDLYVCAASVYQVQEADSMAESRTGTDRETLAGMNLVPHVANQRVVS